MASSSNNYQGQFAEQHCALLLLRRIRSSTKPELFVAFKRVATLEKLNVLARGTLRMSESNLAEITTAMASLSPEERREIERLSGEVVAESKKYRKEREKLLAEMNSEKTTPVVTVVKNRDLFETGPLAVPSGTPAGAGMRNQSSHGNLATTWRQYEQYRGFSHGAIAFMQDGLGGVHEWGGDLNNYVPPTRDSTTSPVNAIPLQLNNFQTYRLLGNGPHWGHDLSDEGVDMLSCGIDAIVVAGMFLSAGSTKADIEHINHPSTILNPIALEFLRLWRMDWVGSTRDRSHYNAFIKRA
ncbi:hypothetical protein HYFRA_00008997 [Hymenoscyphus fraxineus]|uniref:Uncharacterized protein n=1 Tax=Hymenoscyphus fraxineus TaxID=746836 RepID=A0A9N9KU76_9HELO|nr:hypothetical protein HYFRA_00008997 [Hymenoscyphus fraxineus]